MSCNNSSEDCAPAGTVLGDPTSPCYSQPAAITAELIAAMEDRLAAMEAKFSNSLDKYGTLRKKIDLAEKKAKDLEDKFDNVDDVLSDVRDKVSSLAIGPGSSIFHPLDTPVVLGSSIATDTTTPVTLSDWPSTDKDIYVELQTMVDMGPNNNNFQGLNVYLNSAADANLMAKVNFGFQCNSGPNHLNIGPFTSKILVTSKNVNIITQTPAAHGPNGKCTVRLIGYHY